MAATDAPVPEREIPIDTSYRWARTRYNTTQRTASFWIFALTLRARLTLLDQQWSYLGGYSEEKCAQLPLSRRMAVSQSQLQQQRSSAALLMLMTSTSQCYCSPHMLRYLHGSAAKACAGKAKGCASWRLGPGTASCAWGPSSSKSASSSPPAQTCCLQRPQRCSSLPHPSALSR